ncbi:MAG: glycogen-debranching protein [Candidatus Riflebacteria bacterium]|nr:glycogen-debranching protein [Candidatus Riflebacteria bacterium]
MSCRRSRIGLALFVAGAVLLPSIGLSDEPIDRNQRRATAFARMNGADGAARVRAEQGQLAWKGELTEGATVTAEGVRFVLRAENATRVELELFGPFDEVADRERANDLGTPTRAVAMERRDALWVADVAGAKAGEVYGYRVWGPNWPHDPSFRPGSNVGFKADVDGHGNRFNPNKLLIDPRAKVLTRDPDWSVVCHVTGPKSRLLDSAAYQGKAIVVDDRFDWGADRKPCRPLKDSIVYEVHVKGLTKAFPGVAEAGTYRALADDRVIAYLKRLGVTAVELLPVQESPNDANDANPGSTQGKNYWGYMTLGYFAPDRRYSADQRFDGPVREFKSMVKKLHAAGLEVLLDVVYNHTAEGGTWPAGPETATFLSFRGIDNQLFYELTGKNQFFWDNSGCGGNLRTAYPATGQFVVDSLKYWADVMHVDGFRFDLASVLGNGRDKDGFSFQRDGGLLEKIAGAIGRGKGVKLVAEPWACGDGTYQVGNFPSGWAEWNGQYRDTLRKFLKGDASAGDMIDKVNGSYGLYGDDGRGPFASVNFVTAHDGLSLFDLVSYNVNSSEERDRLNSQQWPRGPSDGGEERNNSWNCVVPGASADAIGALRRQQARNALTVLMLSNGTPMLLGGDERLRTQHGNNNAYNLDSETSWLEWTYADRVNHVDSVKMGKSDLAGFEEYARNVIRLRREFPAFHKEGWWAPDRDQDGDGAPGVQWLGPQGGPPDYAAKHFGYRLDGAREELGMSSDEYQKYPMRDRDLLVLVNSAHEQVDYKVPAASGGKAWYRMIDTASWAEAHGNCWAESAQEKIAGSYGLNPRSVVVLVQR